MEWTNNLMSKTLLFIGLIIIISCRGFHTYAANISQFPVDSTVIVAKRDSSDRRYVRIDKIFIIGNKLTKPQIVLRELDVNEGEIFYFPDLKAALEIDKNKLINTRLFNSVQIHTLEVDKYLVDIIIEVKERWYTFPLPIFSLADRNFNDWIQNHDAKLNRVNYGLRFYQYNFRGRNERLRGIAQFGFTKKFELSYTIPYINRAQKNGLTFFGGYAENKSIPYKTTDHKLVFVSSDDILKESVSAGITFSRRSSFFNTQFLSLSYNSNLIADTVALLNSNYLLDGRTDQKYLQLKYTFNRDKRDIQAYPLKGYLVTVEATKLGLGIFKDLDQTELRTNYSEYIDLGKLFYLSTSLTAKTSFPKKQPYINFPGLGYGRDVLRGYELYVIEGQHYLFNKISLKRKLLGGDINLDRFMPIDQFKNIPLSIYFKLFFDSGLVKNDVFYPENTLFTNEYIYGGGFGFDIVTFYDTVIRLEYSINKEKESGFFFHFRADI